MERPDKLLKTLVSGLLATALVVIPVKNQAFGQAGTWTKKASAPAVRVHGAVGAVNNILYVVGGVDTSFRGLSTVEAYDPATNTWTAKAPMPTARSLLAVGVVKDILYAVGGADANGRAFATVEAYDPATNTWTAKAPMPTARSLLAVGVVKNILYAIGGADANGRTFATVETYDPATNIWTAKAPTPTARGGLAVGVVKDVLYAVGGIDAVGNNGRFLSTLEAFDPATNTWTTKAPMPTARVISAVMVFAVGVVKDILYAVGDAPVPLGVVPVTTVEVYDPDTNSWTKKAPMPLSNVFGAGVVNNILYVVGSTNLHALSP